MNNNLVFFGFDNLAALVISAIGAGMVRLCGFTALRTG
jgi:hypothetical protein